MHEIVQLVLRSNDLGSTRLVCGASSERDEWKEVERRVDEAQCWLAAIDLRLGPDSDGLSMPPSAGNRAAASCCRQPGRIEPK